MLKSEDPYTEVHEMLNKIKAGQISNDFILTNAEMTIQQYSKEFLPKKLKKVLDKIPTTIQPKRRASIICHYIHVVVKYMIYEILYRKERRSDV